MTSQRTEPSVLALRVSWLLLAAGGLLLIVGWAILHHDLARAVGWLCTGIAFAIQMVYAPKRKKRSKDPAEDPAEDPAGDPVERSQDDPSDRP